MTDKTQLTPGDLKISVSSDSVFLGVSVPIEVRDSRHRLVSRTTSTKLKLPPGLYEVSAVLEDGRRHSAVVDVVSGQQTPVTLVADEEATAENESNAYLPSAAQQAAPPPPAAPRAPGAGAAAETASPQSPAPASPGATTFTSAAGDSAASLSFRGAAQNRFTRRMYDNMDGDVPSSEAAASVTFVEARGATLVRTTRTLHIFQSEQAITEVPSAMFAQGDRRLITSLPISPQGGSPSGSCAVRVESIGARVRVQAWITPQRTVANALQNMLASHHLLQAADVASSAITLLRDKYDDPTGAALGALLLYKTGRLAQFESWLENLARDFDWLPDGAILLARLRADRGPPSVETLDRCLRAASQRPLYAECHALLMDLLRRWPGGSRSEPGPKPEERAQAIARLSAVAPFVDAGAICFSHWVPFEEGA